ncbi:MAG: DUF3576 domain-containing protein [Gemmatimonas sp.]
MKLSRRFVAPVAILAAAAFTLVACGEDTKVEQTYPDSRDQDPILRGFKKDSEGLFGSDGLLSYGKKDDQGAGSGIAVNSFLWRASLDTLSFMPLASADPFGGVIITDWYAPPETPNARFKANVFILDRQLRADGIKVTLFQQRRDASGSWVDAEVNRKTATELEDAILTRARQLRIAAASAR